MSDVLSQENREEIRTRLNSELESHLQPDTEAVGFIIISADDKGTRDSLALTGTVSPRIAMTALLSAVIEMGARMGVSPRLTVRAINAGAAFYADLESDAEEEISPAGEVRQ